MISTSATLDAGTYSFLKLSKESETNGNFYVNVKIFDKSNQTNSIHTNRFVFNKSTDYEIWKLEDDSELFKTHSDDDYIYLDIVLKNNSAIRVGTDADSVCLYPAFTGFKKILATVNNINFAKTDMQNYAKTFTFDATVRNGNFVYVLEGLIFDSEVKHVKQIITGSTSDGVVAAIHYEQNTTCSESSGVFTISTAANARCYANVHWD